MHYIARALANDSELKTPLVAALRDRTVSVAVIRLQERRAELARVSRLSFLYDALLRSIDGEGSIVDVLNGDAQHTDALIADARSAQRELSNAVTVERERGGKVAYRVSREILELPQEIAALEALIRRFDVAREQYLDNLREKGLDPRMLARIEPTPTHEDLALWRSALEVKRQRLDRLRAYDKSGPFFETSLLGDDVLNSLNF